jgi:hypothetical protein
MAKQIPEFDLKKIQKTIEESKTLLNTAWIRIEDLEAQIQRSNADFESSKNPGRENEYKSFFEVSKASMAVVTFSFAFSICLFSESVNCCAARLTNHTRRAIFKL